jgi:hypothetical protein
MSRPDTTDLKHYLKQMKRQSVSHPDLDGERVRVEDVTREFWSYRRDGEISVRQFSAMRQEQIDRILAGGEG